MSMCKISEYLSRVRQKEREEVIHVLPSFENVAEQHVEVSWQVIHVEAKLSKTGERLKG